MTTATPTVGRSCEGLFVLVDLVRHGLYFRTHTHHFQFITIFRSPQLRLGDVIVTILELYTNRVYHNASRGEECQILIR